MNDLRGLLKHLSSQTYANTCYMFQHPWINKEDQLKTPLQVRLYIDYRPLYSRMKRFPALLNSPMIQGIQSTDIVIKHFLAHFLHGQLIFHREHKG